MILGICVETCLLFILPLFLYDGLCFTHWMVTDDGLTIKSVPGSPFHMVQPHSLVQFLDQGRKLDSIAHMRGSIKKHKNNIHIHENADDPELETKIRKTDKDCIMGGFMSTSKDAFLLAYTLGKLVEDLEILASVEFNDDKQKPRVEPHCTYDLQFSMYAFEHFPSVQQRDKLKIIPEAAFQKLLPPNYATTEFGSHVARALEMQPTNDSFLRLAALYWRIKGDAPKAIECFRRALHFTAKEMQARTMFDFGNLVHRAGYPLDAIVLYQLTLLKINDALIRMALGDAYALVQNRSEAIEQYDIAFSIDPSMKSAQVKAAALKCDQKLISAMEEQHRNLLDTIEEKNLYNDKYEAIKKLEESTKGNVIGLEQAVQSTLIHDYFTYGSLPYSSCRSVSVSGRLVMQCSVSDWHKYRAVRDERHRKLVANFKRNGAKNTPKYNARIVENLNDSYELTVFLEKLELMKEMNMDKPVGKPVYPRKLLPSTNKLLENYLSSSWPNKTLCESTYWHFSLPTPENLPQLFLSPENKGFKSSDLLGKYLGLNDGEEHPLPWNPPVCGIDISEESLPAILKLPGIHAAAERSPSLQFAEDKLRMVFLKIMDDKITEADIAQRIGTLMKYKIGPQWIVYNLAALYWRIVGAPGEAVTCLRAALQIKPERYADVALVQLAQIIIRSGISYDDHLNDAAVLLNSAMHLDPNEPIIHFLLGIVRILQKKHTIALVHVRAAVILDPLFQPAVAMLRALKCLSKNEQQLVGERLHLRCCSQAESNVYCLGIRSDRCFMISKEGAFIGITCAIDSKRKGEDSCKRAFSFALFILPLNPSSSKETDEKVRKQLTRQAKITGLKTTMDFSDEIPLDYGAEESLRKIQKMTVPSTESFFQSEILFTESDVLKESRVINSWELDVFVDKIVIPEGQLTLAHVPERRRMIAFDIPLPPKLPLPFKHQITNGFSHMPLPSKRKSNSNFCANTKMSLAIVREQSTSTWLSATAKGVNLDEFIDFETTVDLDEDFEPICPELLSPSPLLTLDHLPAYHLRHQFIHYKPEKGLTDAFLKLGKEKERVEVVAKRLKDAMALSVALNKGGVHWSLSTASALYWRVKGDAVNALKCLRQSLNSAPPDMRDVALVSMANIYQQAGLLHSALIAGGFALKISPKLVAIHFTLANIYASLEKYQHALMFYYSTLSMQPKFEPAKERIRTIYCFAKNLSIKS
ncbi:TPR Domain containing protein [Loa loa]|uniref:TPR Domain containing protein n=2 Tax=Loa loa TaxID=7209 RepID=A0A1S0UHS5_LOALO|nr:TPR Domain containing protein [Loa loa]EJD75230.1 TPR Domain containing protein [Loa loa]